jgi:heterotetrameric sarcosine oxidase gamma subunit
MTKATPETALQQAGVLATSYDSPDGEAILSIREVSHATVIRLQTLLSPQELKLTLAEAGIDLSLGVGQSTGQDPATLCIGPREWLLFSEFLDADRVLAKCHSSVDRKRSTLNDHSDAMAVIRVSGSASSWLMSKMSCLDFHAATRHGQHCATTLFGQITAVVHYHEVWAEFLFDLIIDRGYASPCWKLLLASAPHAEELFHELGVPV